MRNLVVEQEQRKPEFLPIHVSFIIESEDELKELCCRLNLNTAVLSRLNNVNYYKFKPCEDYTHPLWSKLNELVEQTCRKDS